MCGFAGFVGEVEDREQVLVNMMNTIIHRGPDSEGKYVDEDAALGFRRLLWVISRFTTRIGVWSLSSTERYTITRNSGRSS